MNSPECGRHGELAKQFPALLCVMAAAAAWTVLSWPLAAGDQVTKGTWEEAMRAASELEQQGKYAEASAMMSAVLETAERLGVRGARAAIILNNMASLHQDTGRYAESEKHYKRALRILEKDSGADPALVVTTVNNLALLYYDARRYGDSERLLARYRPAVERLGPDAPETWTFMTNLATCDLARRRFPEAEAGYKQVISAVGRNHGPDLALAPSLTHLGILYAATGRYREALGHLERSLDICRRSFGDGHPETLRPLLTISRAYARSGQLPESERFAKEALAIAVRALGTEHPLTGRVLSNYAFVLRRSGRKAEAKKLEEQARVIQEKTARDNPAHHMIDVTDFLEPGRK